MAYFSNGSEGLTWEDKWCSRCVHLSDEGGCSVIVIHSVYNYDQHKEGETGKAIADILNLLIPRSADKLENERCSMFVERPDGG